MGVESRSEGERSARHANEDARFDAARPGFGPSQRELFENESAREQKQSTTESLQQRTGRGRFDGRDALASNKALGSPSIETDRLSSRAREKTPNPHARDSSAFSRRLRAHVDGHELRQRLGFTKTLKLSLVVRFRLADRHHGPEKGGDLREKE